MDTREEIFDYINKKIVQENGLSLSINDTISDAELDSLGLVFFISEIDNRYNTQDSETSLDITIQEINNMPVKDLINLCKKYQKSDE